MSSPFLTLVAEPKMGHISFSFLLSTLNKATLFTSDFIKKSLIPSTCLLNYEADRGGKNTLEHGKLVVNS